MISDATNPAHALGHGVPFKAAVRFTTDGSNDPTLTQSHDGQVAISRSTNTYTLTFPEAWDTTDAVVVTHSAHATLNVTETNAPASKTVTLAFSGAFASGTCSVVLHGRVNK